MRLGLHSLGGDGGTLRRNADGPAGNCRRGRRIQDIYRSSRPSCRENLESVQPNRRRARSDPDGPPAITVPRAPATGELRATSPIGASHAAPLADVLPWLSIDRCEPDAGQRANGGRLNWRVDPEDGA